MRLCVCLAAGSLLVVGCGSSGGSRKLPVEEPEAPEGGSGNKPATKFCYDSYQACTCGDDLEGFEVCDEEKNPVCNCDAPVQLSPLKSCLEPCGGDVTGEWLLSELCTPQWANGNCAHAVHDTEAEPQPSALSFGTDGTVRGNLAYSTKLFTSLTKACAAQKDLTLSYSECAGLDQSLEQRFRLAFGTGFKSNSCELADDVCECQTSLTSSGTIDAKYLIDSPETSLLLGGTRLDYCVKDDTLSLRQDADSTTFTFVRSQISLPFEATVLGEVRDVPAPARPLTLDNTDCGSKLTLDTDTLTASCSAGSVRGVEWGASATPTFFMRSLVVPAGKQLVFKGSRPGVIVADTIDIEGRVTFERTDTRSTVSLGVGLDGMAEGAGGGAHCTAGGLGVTASSTSGTLGGSVFGAFAELNFGGDGGQGVYNSSDTNVDFHEVSSGGRGGGAIAFFASTSIDISGTIDVSGGQAGETPASHYGGGGGAGGTLVLEAPTVVVAKTAKLLAAGGSGGGLYAGVGANTDANGGNAIANAGTQSGGGGGVGRIVIHADGGAKDLDLAALTPAIGSCTSLGTLTALDR